MPRNLEENGAFCTISMCVRDRKENIVITQFKFGPRDRANGRYSFVSLEFKSLSRGGRPEPGRPGRRGGRSVREKVRFKMPVALYGLSEISVLETGKPQVQVGFHVVLKRCIERSLGRASFPLRRRLRGGSSGGHIFVHMLPRRGLARHTATVRALQVSLRVCSRTSRIVGQ